MKPKNNIKLTIFEVDEEMRGLSWESLSTDQKTDFIGSWLLKNESSEDLIERAMELIFLKNQIKNWYDNSKKIQNVLWKDLSYEKKSDVIENELKKDWDTEQLVEKIVDDLDVAAINYFKKEYK